MKTEFSSPDSVVESISELILSSGHSSMAGKEKRAFQRLVSGFTRARFRGDRLRFMTLTTGPGGVYRRLARNFQVLRKMIFRRFGFLIQYWRLRTDEGNGVLHIVFKGGFIPQDWLSKAWNSIHGAPIVDIRVLRGSARCLANYLVTNYLCKQAFERMSWSWGWVFRGFCGLWASKYSSWYKVAPSACLKAWNYLICHVPDRQLGIQSKLGG